MKKGLKTTLDIIFICIIFLAPSVYAQSVDIIIPNDVNVSSNIVDIEQDTHDSETVNINKVIIIERAKIINNIIDKIPIIFSSIVSVMALIIGYKTGKQQNSLNLITNNRIEWQETIRNELADFIGDLFSLSLHYYQKVSGSSQDNQDVKSMFSAISKLNAEGNRIILRLNPVEDIRIIEIIKDIIDIDLPEKPEDIEGAFGKMLEHISALVSESHIMLKKEWEKIKEEAGYKIKPKQKNLTGK